MDNTEREGFIAYSTLPSFKRKVEKAKETIKEALAITPAYVAVSWGKDSTVLLHLCQQVKPDIVAYFNTGYFMDTYDNFTEICNQYIERFPTQLIIWEETEEEALSGINRTSSAKSAFASDAIKSKTNICHNVVFLGLRKQESKPRRITLLKYGEIYTYKNGITRVCPLANWVAQDIWAYICKYDLPYLSSYDRISKMSHSSRTTPHITPLIAKTSGGAETRELLSLYSQEFKHLLLEFRNK